MKGYFIGGHGAYCRPGSRRRASVAAGLTGQTAERLLEQAGITSNKNPIPFDVRNPAKWSGLRLGVAAATTRGLRETEMERVGQAVASVLRSAATGDVAEAQQIVARLCRAFPIYARSTDGAVRLGRE